MRGPGPRSGRKGPVIPAGKVSMEAHPVGAKARRVTTQTEGQAASPNDEFSPWRTAARPLSSSAPQDNRFTVEDESVASIVETLMFSFTISDPQQKGNPIVFLSPGFETLTGYTSDEMLGVNCKVLQELTNFRKDGRAFQNFLCIVPVLDAYDNLLRFVGLQCDMDDKRKREHADEHFTSKWSDQVRHHVSAFMLTDNSHDSAPITAVSPGFTALMGYTQMDLLGCGCLCVAGPDSNTKMMRKWVMSQWADKPVAVKLLCYRKDGSPLWCYLFSCPLTAARGSSSRQTMCLVVDITSTRLKRVGKYVLGKVIGNGAYGIVRIGKASGTEDVVAVKSVDASRFRSIAEIEQIQEEMSVLSSLKHAHIIRLIEIHFINQIFFLVMEFASGGSLVQHIRAHAQNRLPEPEAHRIFMQISSAVDYCHRRRIIHRDLKPENILMDDKANVKIGDFGLAAVTAPFSKGLTQQCGTPEFAAPEIITGKEYDGPSVDIWSMGVILYEVLAGNLPFQGATQPALFKAIQRGVFAPLPSHVSASCKDLIKGMLTVDAQMRYTMDEILRHPWCKGGEQAELSSAVNQMDLGGSDGEDGLDQESAELGGPASSNGRQPLASNKSEHYTDGDDSESPFIVYQRGSVSRAESRATSDAGDLEGTASDWRPSLPSLSRQGSSKRPSMSGMGTHDSVRLVIDADQDDPITAAIMRAQAATMSILSSISNGDRDGGVQRHSQDNGEAESEAAGMVRGAASGTSSFTAARTNKGGGQLGRDMTPGRPMREQATVGATTSRLGTLRRNAAPAHSTQQYLPPLPGSAGSQGSSGQQQATTQGLERRGNTAGSSTAERASGPPPPQPTGSKSQSSTSAPPGLRSNSGTHPTSSPTPGLRSGPVAQQSTTTTVFSNLRSNPGAQPTNIAASTLRSPVAQPSSPSPIHRSAGSAGAQPTSSATSMLRNPAAPGRTLGKSLAGGEGTSKTALPPISKIGSTTGLHKMAR